MPQPVMLKKLKLNGSMRPTRLLELTPKKDVLFIIGDWNAKVGSQEKIKITVKVGLEIQNVAGQIVTVPSRETAGHSKHPFLTT